MNAFPCRPLVSPICLLQTKHKPLSCITGEALIARHVCIRLCFLLAGGFYSACASPRILPGCNSFGILSRAVTAYGVAVGWSHLISLRLHSQRLRTWSCEIECIWRCFIKMIDREGTSGFMALCWHFWCSYGDPTMCSKKLLTAVQFLGDMPCAWSISYLSIPQLWSQHRMALKPQKNYYRWWYTRCDTVYKYNGNAASQFEDILTLLMIVIVSYSV